MRGSVIATWLLGVSLAAAGCGGDESSPGGNGGGGAGGGGGGADVPCVDIHVDARVLDDPTWDGPALSGVRKAFWRTERGLHVAWLGFQNDSLPVQLIVSTFDPETGGHLGSVIYDPFPSDTGYAVLVDAAGAPDGSFALVVNYSDEGEVWGVADRVALGHLDAPGVLTLWDPPYNGAEAAPIHIGWDGETFAMHAIPVPAGDLPMHLSRLLPDGTVIGADIEVGAPMSPDRMYGAIRTDAASGRTWTVSAGTGGVWLGGHDREGSLLPGTEGEGRVFVEAVGATQQGSTANGVSVAYGGTEAMLGWFSGAETTRAQRVEDSTPVGDAVLVPMEKGAIDEPQYTVVERQGAGWWLAMLRSYTGIVAYSLSDSAVLSDRALVRHERCDSSPDGCAPLEDYVLQVSHLQSLRYQDELWLGFVDGSGAFLDGRIPYRVVRVGGQCQYGSEALVLQGR